MYYFYPICLFVCGQNNFKKLSVGFYEFWRMGYITDLGRVVLLLEVIWNVNWISYHITYYLPSAL